MLQGVQAGKLPFVTDTAAIVVNYNGGLSLSRCLTSVLEQTPAPKTILVVDNGSTDDSMDHLDSSIQTLRLAQNDGYGAALRAGLESTEEPYLLFLNADTQLEPECLAAALSALESDATLGSVAPRVLQASESDRIDSDGIGLTTRCGQISWNGGRQAGRVGETVEEVLGPLGGAGLWRREAIEAGGGIPGGYFLYWEDVHLALAIQGAGWSSRTVPEARVLHEGGGAVGRGSARNVYYMVRNHLPCLAASLPSPLLRRYFFSLVLAPLRAALLYSGRGHPLAALLGLLSSLFLLPRALLWRQDLPSADQESLRRIRDLMETADTHREKIRRGDDMENGLS